MARAHKTHSKKAHAKKHKRFNAKAHPRNKLGQFISKKAASRRKSR